MSQINISNLTFAYEGSYDNIFENASFQIDTDWKTGLIGRNGRGKTTFLNLLMGKYKYSGTISSSADFEYFPFNIPDDDVNTIDIAEFIFSDFEYWKLSREINLLGMSDDILYRPYSTLSGGEKTKFQLAVLFLKESKFLLIDEPTNHLDAEGRETVAKYLSQKKGFILVSHDRAFLDKCADHIISINKTNIEIQKGNFSSWLLNKEQRDKFELTKNEKLKKDITRLSQSAQRTAKWSDKVEKTKCGTKNSGLRPDRGFIGHKSAKMMKRSKSIVSRKETAIEEKASLLKNIETTDSLKIHQVPFKTKQLIHMENVSIKYDANIICDNINLDVLQGDRVAIEGKNGSGKSSILKLICGEKIEHGGTVQIGSGLIVSYLPQDVSFLSGSLKEYSIEKNLDETLFKTILRKLDFSRIQFEKDMNNYSLGQKKKVLIAQSLCEKSNLIIWDEPLNYIDIFSRMQIENLLSEFKPTMIFVEHDKIFYDSIANKTIHI